MKTPFGQSRTRGFTIVEILIVISIIGILAAVTIIAYNGVQQKARDTAVLSDTDAVASEMTRYSVNNNGVFGSSLAWYSPSGTNTNIKVTPSSGNIIDVVATDTAYCIRVYNLGASQYKSLATALKKGSSATACILAASAGAIADSPLPPVVNQGVVTTLAGSTEGSADGVGSAAQFKAPNDVTVDASGTIYVADTQNHRIRKITPSGAVTTLAGSIQGFVDGAGTAARFSLPQGIVASPSGTVYVADSSNNRIRKITPAGEVTTFAGSTQGSADGSGAAAQFNNPRGLAIDANGTLYVADRYNYRIRKITPAGVVSTLAGSTIGNADGTGTAAQFNMPYSLAVDSSGTVYTVDAFNNRIRKITPTGVVTTLAGTSPGFLDGTGTAARFNEPYGIAVDPWGVIYVADTFNHRIRKITSTGVVTTLAGSSLGATDGTGSGAQFNYPVGLTIDSAGTIYVVDNENDRIRKIQ